MYQIVKPPEHLRKYIDCFWVGEDDNLSNTPNTFHAIATTRTELLFFYRGDYAAIDLDGKMQKVHTAGFYGQTTAYRHYFASNTKTCIFGIRLFPLAFLTFFNRPANELTDQAIDIQAILGSAGKELTDKIFSANSFSEKVSIAINFFNKRLKFLPLQYSIIANALAKIQRSSTSINISDLTLQSHLSQRQFERNFKVLAGFSARTYLKLVRFEKFVEAAACHRSLTEKRLTDIAFQLGYYDQAHLNHHFKEFTGIKPTAYFPTIVL